MNNIGIILNQDKNQPYLGKFYNRNTLEFPVIRKIYEQIEMNRNNENNSHIDLTNLSPKNDGANTNTNTNIINPISANDISIIDEGCMEHVAVIENNNIQKQPENINSNIIETISPILEIEKKQQYNYNLNKYETIFLWMSSILLMTSLHYNIFKNMFS